ncbi:MAG TPA: hypothetical protein VE544_02225 [Nitrososphaeraceae archaeon]|nr:hypothetical protein [Nitrososphaeraceae archaeon]
MSRGTYVSIGDIHFMPFVKHDMIWREINDVDGMIKLIQSLKRQGASAKTIERINSRRGIRKD